MPKLAHNEKIEIMIKDSVIFQTFWVFWDFVREQTMKLICKWLIGPVSKKTAVSNTMNANYATKIM